LESQAERLGIVGFLFYGFDYRWILKRGLWQCKMIKRQTSKL